LNSTINIRAGRGPMDSILTDHRILTQKENPAFYDSMSTCHVNPARHADAIWLERLHLDKETAKCFQEKFHAYNKATMGQSKILPAERHRFVKSHLNYRKFDLPHAHNPVTDHVVPSFDCRPLPERGHPLDQENKRGVRHRPGSRGPPMPAPCIDPLAAHASPRSISAPPLYPTVYSKKRGIMHWRSYVERSGKNNINYIKSSNYCSTMPDPWMDKRRRADSNRVLAEGLKCATLTY